MPFEELISSGVRRKLSALKRALCAHLIGRGSAWVVVALVAAVFLTLGVDRALKMDRAQRALIVGLALVGVGYVSWRFLIRPLLAPMDAEELALVLERHYPQLDDRLISALQFSAYASSRFGASEDLIRAVARQANALAGELDPARPVLASATYKRMGIAAAAAAVLLVFTVFNAGLMKLWFQRNVLFADVPWPRQTYLTVAGGPTFKVVRGGILPVIVTAEAKHVVPREVTFHMDFPGLGKVSENVTAVSPGANTYIKFFNNVTDGFRFRVTGNDDETDWFDVVVVEPPMLERAHFTVEYPEYMSRDSAKVTSEHGVLSVPPGSRIRIDGWASKNLSAARLVLEGLCVVDLDIVADRREGDPSGKLRPLRVQGILELPERIKHPSMQMRFELADAEGITNPRGAVFALRVERDRAPTVKMTHSGVHGDVTAKATIPLEVRAEDDHAIAAMDVTAKPMGALGTTTQPTTAPSEAEEKTFVVPDVPKDQKLVTAAYPLDLRPMGLAEGSWIRVWASAGDNLPASFGGPNTAKGPVQTFRIVSEEELLAKLIRREKEIREEFSGVVTLQAEVRDRARGVRDRLADAVGINQEMRRNLNVASQGQRMVATKCGVVVQQLQEVLDEMTYNRLGDPANRARLSDLIIRPLREISKKPMLDMAEAIGRASKQEDAAALREFTGTSSDILADFHGRLKAILDEMRQLESRQELARALKQLIKQSERLRKEIEKEMEQRGQKLFDRTTQPAP